MNVLGDKHDRVVREKLGSEMYDRLDKKREITYLSFFSDSSQLLVQKHDSEATEGEAPPAQRGFSELVFTKEPTVAISA